MLEVPGSRGIFSAARFSTSHASACASISAVISLHCVSLDSIRPRLRGGKKLDTERIRVNIGASFSYLLSSSSFDAPSRRPGSPSLSVGVNLSPRLSPNTELYKLKPISLPGLRSSYLGHFIFVYLLSANMPGLLCSSQQWRRYPACTPGYTALSRRILSAYVNALIRVSSVCTRRAAHNRPNMRASFSRIRECLRVWSFV